MVRIFYKEKIADRRIIHFCGFKFSYRRKYDIKSVDKELVQKEINNFSEVGVNSIPREKRLIVSLTSFPQRMYDIHFGIYSLLSQSVKPDKVILWLGEDKFPNREKDLPENVIKLMQNGLTIRFCKDIKSYTKLVPALCEFPNDIIATADDDIFYEQNWLELLYNEYLNNPKAIHCHRANSVTINKNEINPSKKWISPDRMTCNCESYAHFLTGVGGVLYPPNSLHKDTTNKEIFIECAPNHDDAWFWSMAILNGTKVNIIKNNIYKLTYINPERELQFNNEKTLWSDNKNEGDAQIINILNKYPEIKEKLINGAE